MEQVTSIENPWVKKVRDYLRASSHSRKFDGVWLEGDHLIRAALTRGWKPRVWFWNEQGPQHPNAEFSSLQSEQGRHICVPVSIMNKITSMESAPPVSAWLSWADQPLKDLASDTHHSDGLVLDRLQDPGNVGTILRSAAAMGFKHIWSLRGTVSMWSPKVLRSGMGAHFSLVLHEGCVLDDIRALNRPLTATSSHEGQWLHQAVINRPCTFVLGHEGQGISPDLAKLATDWVRIYQPAGEESLNVGVAAGICMHSAVVLRL